MNWELALEVLRTRFVLVKTDKRTFDETQPGGMIAFRLRLKALMATHAHAVWAPSDDEVKLFVQITANTPEKTVQDLQHEMKRIGFTFSLAGGNMGETVLYMIRRTG